MRKAHLLLFVVALGLLACAAVSGRASAQRRRSVPRPAAVCPDPTVRCRTTVEFQPYQLPFRVPANGIIWETEKFYAVILKSVRDENPRGDCDVFIPEAEREAAQALFPRNKVFSSRCAEAGEVFYTEVSGDAQFMAVYAGRTRAEANAMLEKVRATGRFPGANLRRMNAGFNGT
ncbi:MAG TPA: hypothetical protein VF659_16790 [Pyrinomonadaceae bacterium]|jgi:hypothetical protein